MPLLPVTGEPIWPDFGTTPFPDLPGGFGTTSGPVWPVDTTSAPGFPSMSTAPLLEGQTGGNCEKYDIVFLPQNSNSVRWSNFEQFMYDFSRKVLIDNEASRVAIVPFGRKPTSDDIINFIDYSTKTELLEKIRATEKSKIRGHFVEKGRV